MAASAASATPPTWDPDPEMLNPAYPRPRTCSTRRGFRAGFAELGKRGLSFEAWLYFHQIPRPGAPGAAHPEVPIVLNHCGGVLGIGGYAGRRDEVFAAWSANMRALAACPNVMVKLGGLGMRLPGFGLEQGAIAPSSQMLVDAWRPWMETDHRDVRHRAAACSRATSRSTRAATATPPAGTPSSGWRRAPRADAKDDLFWRSAARFYRIDA